MKCFTIQDIGNGDVVIINSATGKAPSNRLLWENRKRVNESGMHQSFDDVCSCNDRGPEISGPWISMKESPRCPIHGGVIHIWVVPYTPADNITFDLEFDVSLLREIPLIAQR